MLRYIYADQLDQFPRLAQTMFRDGNVHGFVSARVQMIHAPARWHLCLEQAR